MQTMDASLAEWVRRGKVTKEAALRKSSNPEELERLILGKKAA
jgi:Tfp pilus assembly pilus retraction ATPase PilT